MRSKRYNKKRRMIIFLVGLLVLAMGGGFALLSQSIKIRNTATISLKSWAVSLENVVVREGSTDSFSPIIGIDEVSISSTVTLNNPLDFYEYTVDVVNNGNIDAKLDSLVKPNLTETQQKYLNYTITYKDHTEIKKNDLLVAGEKETLRVVVEVKEGADAYLPEGSFDLSLDVQVNYAPNDGTGVPRTKNSLYQQIVKETKSDTEIQFGAISSDTNGLGVYTLSKTVNTANPVLYYRGNVTNNNVIFGGFCWKMIRTTSTGGIKLIYNGEPNNGVCDNTGEATEIGKSAFNTNEDDAKYVGYMYDNNTVNSTVKNVVDEWFANHMLSYQNYLEDTPFYNERDYVEGVGIPIVFAPRQRIWGNGTDNYAETVPNTTIKLGATNKEDIFTVSSDVGNGALTYPVGLLTSDEAILAGGRGWISSEDRGTNTNYYLYTGKFFWTLSPRHVNTSSEKIMIIVDTDGAVYSDTVKDNNAGVRPVLSLKPTTTFMSGNGSASTPYIITN